MKEKNIVLIIMLVLTLVSVLILFLSLFNTNFNFYKTELTINGNEIRETLYFKPDKDYHTLYRDFSTSIEVSGKPAEISINDVACESGTPYANSYTQCISFPEKTATNCFPFTEKNELGCTFGNTLGFKEDGNYYLKSEYILNPNKLIDINGKRYIKFVAYSKNRHPLLIKNKNFIISDEAITKNYFLPNENVIIYIPFSLESKSAIYQNSFSYDGNFLSLIFIIILSFLPPCVFYFVWLKHGKEISHEDVPRTLSTYPRERKGWEVAAFFMPPFSQIDKNFFSAMLLDLKNRKIIDLKSVNKETYIKLPHDISKCNVDEIEKSILELLAKLFEELPEKHKQNDYGNLKKLVKNARFYTSEAKNIQKKVEEVGKSFINLNAKYYSVVLIILLYVVFQINLISGIVIIYYYFAFYFFYFLIFSYTSILSRHKKDYYIEYQRWQAFRKYLKEVSSMKYLPHEAIVLWEQHFVYATALGVSREVLKKLRELNIVNENQYNMYHGVYLSSTSFTTSSGMSGGGIGGGGGGGVGGGGGGGR